MCVGEPCGRYRIYTLSEMHAKWMWLGTDPATPGNPADILLFPRGLRDSGQEPEANRHFRDGLGKKWRTPVHVGDKCGGACRCVKTDEKAGGQSEIESRQWRQPVTLGDDHYVISGTYSLQFQDYKATCDDGCEEGEHAISTDPLPAAETQIA